MSNSLKDLGLSSAELKEISILLAKKRDVKGYQNMPEGELLSALTPSKKAKKGKKPKTSFSKAKIEKIGKEFNESKYKFSKLKIKEIRENIYEIENEKILYESKIKEIEKNVTELEENLSQKKVL